MLSRLFIYFIFTRKLTSASTPIRLGRFSTKTSYKSAFAHNKFVKGIQGDILIGQESQDMNANTNTLQLEEPMDLLVRKDWPDRCTPIQVNSLIRHGIRNAGKKELDRFDSVLKRISSVIEHSHSQLHGTMLNLQEILSRTPPKDLLEEGRVEQRLLAKRILKKYSELFTEDLDSSDVLLMVSSSKRTLESCESFRSAWQQHWNTVQFNPDIVVDDSVLRFFDHCAKYIADVENNKKISLAEYYKFVKGHFPSIAANITARLALDSSLSIHQKEVKSLFVLAALEVATLGTTDLFNLFDVKDAVKMEYALDLKNFWKKSFGHQINYEQSCPLLLDILHHMDEAVTGSAYHKGVFRFAHAETLLPLQALIGLFKDESKLRADNLDLHEERLFRTSHISPFSGNLNFVLFECDMDKGQSANEGAVWSKYMVQLLVNEQPHKIPGWDHDLCPYHIFRERYQTVIDMCDLDTVCKRDTVHVEL